MSIRRFRKPTVPWRAIFLVGAVTLLIVGRWCFPVGRTTLDPTRLTVASGIYVVESVTDSVRLVLRTDSAPAPLRIKLLATTIRDEGMAAAKLRELISEGQQVQVRFDRRRITEDTKELQAYIFVGDFCLNEELVRLGLAREDTHPSDSGPMIRRIKKAEQEAREQRRGVWSDVSED